MTVADLFRAIKRHWILEIILFVVTVGAVAGFTFTATPMYSAQIQLMPKATASADASTAQSSSAAASSAAAQLANYIKVTRSTHYGCSYGWLARGYTVKREILVNN